MKHEGWDVGRLVLPLGDEQLDRLEAYERLLREHALPPGMISARDASRLRERHVVDSLRAAATVLPGDRTAYDLGSGAGLPGVVVAIARPELLVTLVESRRSRASFLELVVDRLGLSNTRVHVGRVEKLTVRVDLCFARAFAGPAGSWRAAEPLLTSRGRLVYFAGAGFRPETVPEDVKSTLVTSSALARSGPLVIMSRQ
ncbi:MAG: 16S rRNA (guanine(527)-N(7))-methyltransferase RsmG [Actinomycetota bacterium]